jgi:hypothetical protein
MVEPPVEDAPKRRSGKFDEYAFHHEPSQAGVITAFRLLVHPGEATRGDAVPQLTEPQVTDRQTLRDEYSDGSSPVRRPGHPFALP